MALTAQEEALVRQLLGQQAAILSLAANEATITSKLGATKVTLADLVAASSLADADLLLTRQGTNDKSVTAKKLAEYIASQVGIPTAVAGGTADAITADFTPNVALTNGTTVIVRASAANTTTTPTFAPDGLAAKTIVKGNNLALVAGDIAGAGHWLEMNYDATLDKWVLQNPVVAQASDTRAGIVELATAAEAQALASAVVALTPARLVDAFKGANQSLSANGYQKLPGGLIIQWGVTASINANASLAVTFPISFPNAVFAIVPCGIDTLRDVEGGSATVSGVSTSGFTMNNGLDTARPYYYIAIGL